MTNNLRNALLGIYQQRGELTPQIVVDEARDEQHPLHDRFEWDNDKAGEAYRRVQASELIRSVKITYTAGPTQEPRQVRAFSSLHHSVSPDQRGYVPTDELARDDVSYKVLLRQCEREIAALKQKFGHLKEFGQLLRDAGGAAA